MPDFPGECGRRNGDHRALGMGQAVAAHLGKGQPPQRAPAAGAHNQHIVRAAGQVDQHPAGDKAGKWEAWYRQAIPLAEQRYEDYLKQEDIR